MKIGTLVLLAMTMVGCAGTKIVVDGIEIYARYWVEARQQLSQRASFDLQCDPNTLHYSLLARTARWAGTVGVSGCGQRVTYTSVGRGQWFADGQQGAEQARQIQLQQQRARRNSTQPVIQPYTPPPSTGYQPGRTYQPGGTYQPRSY